MQRPAEHKSPQFAVGAEFNSLTNLKHACKRAAILDIFEFVPEKVDSDRYTLKCKSDACHWYLYASPIAETSV